ncbi:MAG: hypothetical protein IJA07_02600 [Agathobacter sp.]|nr:hypothetical protein [Agathobacter sp.]
MYLLTQDKNKLLEFERIEVTKSFGNYWISAYGKGNASYVTAGEYKSEEEARAEFRHIIDALNNGQMVYEVR